MDLNNYLMEELQEYINSKTNKTYYDIQFSIKDVEVTNIDFDIPEKKIYKPIQVIEI
jgi:hypothetical protein